MLTASHGPYAGAGRALELASEEEVVDRGGGLLT